MITQVTFNDFLDAFKSDEYRNNVFSYNALRALFDYLEELEECSSEPIEFDKIALFSRFTEYKSASEAAETYGREDLEELEAMQWLQTHTNVVYFEGGVIIEDF